MQKVVPLNPGVTQDPAATTSRVLPFPTSGDRTNRTSVCAVLFVDIAEYSKKPVSEQLQVKEGFNAHIAQAIADIAPDERIILDTGDGVAISFLGDPEDALFVAMNLMQLLASDLGEQPTAVRAGINLGPVRLVRDINSQPNIIGDGINVAQRVMSFARPRQVLVSRSYYDVVTRISEDYAHLFAYQGSRTDKHVREHELYELVAAGAEAHEITRKRNHDRRVGEETLSAATRPSAPLMRNPRMAFAFTGFSILALGAAALYYVASAPSQGGSEQRPAASSASAPVQPLAAAAPERLRAADPEPGEPAVEPPVPVQQAAPAAIPARPGRVASPAAARPVARPAAAPPAPVEEGRAPLAALASESATQTRPETGPESRSEPPSEAAQPWKSSVMPAPAQTAPGLEGGANALVQLAISPWGEVFVNGKKAGASPPMTEFELRPGKYRIEVRNGDFKPYRDEVELASNQTIRIKHKFKQPR
jgi:class 3 adenylate cyclase